MAKYHNAVGKCLLPTLKVLRSCVCCQLENSVVAYKAQVAEFEEQIEHLLVRNKQLSKGYAAAAAARLGCAPRGSRRTMYVCAGRVDPVIKEKDELAHRFSEVEQERDEYLQQYEVLRAVLPAGGGG